MQRSAMLDRYRELLGTDPGQSPEMLHGELADFAEELALAGLPLEEIVALHIVATEGELDEWRWPEGRAGEARNQQFLIEVLAAFASALRDRVAVLARERDEVAARAEQERLDLLVSVAHEMRTPLTAALGAIDLIERDLAHERFDRAMPRLGTAREALQRLSRQTMDITRASRGDQHDTILERRDLGAIVARAASWAEAEATEKGIAFVVDIGDRPVLVNADVDALLSVIGNLLTNAIRYTPAEGSVRVSCGSRDADAWIEIADTGIGMSAEVQAHIFEKFYRAPAARAVEAQGLGLGLSMVRDLVHDHGGRIDVWSAPELGSTFRVVLPCAGAGVADPDDADLENPGGPPPPPCGLRSPTGVELRAAPVMLTEADRGSAATA